MRWKECLETVPFHQSSRHLQEDCLLSLPPTPQESSNHLACRLSGQLCLALGLCLVGGLLGTQAERVSREVKYSGKVGGKTSARSSKSLTWRGAPLFCIKCFAVNF